MQHSSKPPASGLWRARLSTLTIALLVFAGEVAAQVERLAPPENNTGIKGKPWLTGFVMLLLVGVVGLGAFLKSKRGHQD
jgi:hypothetical protein